MKLFIAGAAILFSTTLLAQSKKELQAQVNQLKSEIEQLKKPKEIDLNTAHKKASYGLGVLMASNVKKQGGDSLDVESMIAGMQDLFLQKTLKIEEKGCMMIVQEYMQKAMEAKANKIKTESAAFLLENKSKPGVITTASGLQYTKLVSGTGKLPLATDKVTVQYTGKLVDGTMFDSSVGGEPATFSCNQVIPGWTEALLLMHEGDKFMLFIPSELGYGDRGAGAQIPPHAALIFEVELIKVN